MALDNGLVRDYECSLVRQEGLEPPTHSLEGCCSIHLSYWRFVVGVGAPGFEPGTSCSQSRRDTRLRYAPLSLAM